QLLALQTARSPSLLGADTLLFMPDLLAYFLTGEKLTEYTIASTAQLTDPRTRNWSEPVFELFGIPRTLFTDIVEPGTVRGVVGDAFADDAGLPKGIRVVSVAQHDTATAVAAVPTAGGTFAYISSGTWSLLGAETDTPIISPGVLRANYTNEGGMSGKTRVLKNIMGMWIIQECRRVWLMEGECEDYAGLADLAEREKPFFAFFDPDDERFLSRGDMPARIRAYCAETSQKIPETRGQTARMVYECLALKYRWAIERLERDILGYSIDRIHIVGGGSNNTLLNRMTASASGKPVIAGPGEATVIGNLLIQSMALSEIASLQELRQVVRASFETVEFLPESQPQWEEAYGKFLAVTGLVGR
ncbi:MAG: FGGY-family carbohydrate kinase, partial [Clostridia bacterium]|nr:FGGY-family carbohydrate kinase [Clostridia bacterium]